MVLFVIEPVAGCFNASFRSQGRKIPSSAAVTCLRAAISICGRAGARAHTRPSPSREHMAFLIACMDRPFA